VAAALTLVPLLVAGLFVAVRDPGPRVDGAAGGRVPKTVAVLPFHNDGGDSEQDYFAQGLGDDLLTSLARFSDLRVIARDSTSSFGESPLGTREIADRLHVRYLVRGSVRRAGNEVRIAVRLVDADSGETLWADRFDEEITRLFEVQDRITHRIVVALVGRMNVRDRHELSRPRTKSLEAYDHFLYGRKQFFMYAGPEENRDAREAFGRAIALDPDFAMAYAMLAWTHAFDAMNGWSEARDASLALARELASQAIARDDAMPLAYFVRGLSYRESGDRMRALVEAEKAVALDPSYASAHVLLATLLYFDGRAREGLELMRRAIALNPAHPFNYSFHLGQAQFILRHYEEAIEALNAVLESNPAAERVHLWLAAAYAQAGRDEDAQWELEQVLVEDPGISLDEVRRSYPFTDPADLEHLVRALRKAGLSR
jgi:adenylate cyclase